jgi:spermidine/putrescine transport system substrate-binding protein
MLKKLYLAGALLMILALGACAGAATPTEAPPAPTEAMPQPTEAMAQPTEAPAQPAVEPAKEIQIFNWTDYMDPDIYTKFEEATGIKVVESNFASNEEMLAKLQGGATGYDLIVPSDYTVSIMESEGMLAELDPAVLTNLGNLADRFRNVPFDPGNKYCVPYQWGTTGIGYLASQVDEPTSWSVLFNPDPSSPTYGRTTMLDDPREAFAAALVYLGYDINTTDEAQLQEAKQLLIQAKPGLSGYDSDQYDDLLASGESLMAHGWNGDFLVAQEENQDIAYTIPKEGGVVWIDNICIPATTPPDHKLAAEMFINFLLQPDIGAMLSNFTYFASPNAAAEAQLDPEFLADPAVYPPAEVLDKLQYIRPLGEFESTYQRLWDEVKTSNP